ncbi:MAG: sulfotransferase family 2 domain-containing protein [Firmicutes bacterium]|nr:sulfotransferase family 2 domain-containing protein [Bacillota bacterium]
MMNSKKETIIFLHIPKTAGRTFREEILPRQFKPDEYFLINGRDLAEQMKTLETFRSLSVDKKRKYRCIAGHQSFGLHCLLPNSAAYITFLRDPVDRTLSDYYFTLKEPTHHRFIHKVMNEKGSPISLLDFLTDERFGRSNVQTRYLSGQMDEDEGNSKPITIHEFEIAKSNLQHRFIFGLVEKFDESILLFRKRFNWKNVFYDKINVTERPDEEISRDVLELIKEKNRFDIELYNFAKKIFEEKGNELGEGFAQEVKVFKKLNEQYVDSLNKRRECFSKVSFINQTNRNLICAPEDLVIYGNGIKALAEGNFKNALQIFDSLRNKKTKIYGCHYAMALAFLNLGFVEQARSEASLELAIFPNNQQAVKLLYESYKQVPVRITFLLTALNGMLHIKKTLEAVYDTAHEIIAAAGTTADFLSEIDGFEIPNNGTIEFLKHFPDPERKIKFIQGFYPETIDMENKGLELATGDYVWIVSPYEAYKKENLSKVKAALENDPTITQINFIPDKDSGRVFRFIKSSFFLPGENKIMMWPMVGMTTNMIHLIDGQEIGRLGIYRDCNLQEIFHS